VIPEVKSDYRPKMASVDAIDPKKKRIIAVTFDSTTTRPGAHNAWYHQAHSLSMAWGQPSAVS